MKVLVAGAGSIGRRHLRNLLALGEREVALLRTGLATLPDAELAGIPVFRDLGAALDAGFDAVVVANPTALHLDVALPAAQRGCHLLLEKPVSHALDGLDALGAAAAAGGGRVLVGFQFRFHPTLRELAAQLRAGTVGTPLLARVEWGEYLPAWHPWEDYRRGYAARRDLGGGVTRTLCHPFDYLRMVLGEAGAPLWAHTGNTGHLGIEVEETCDAGFRFGDCIASLHLDYLARPPRHILEVVGTEGRLAWDALDGSLAFVSSDGASRRAWQPPEGFERNVMFRDLMAHFLEVCRGAAEPCCTLGDGVRALEMVLAVCEGGKAR